MRNLKTSNINSVTLSNLSTFSSLSVKQGSCLSSSLKWGRIKYLLLRMGRLSEIMYVKFLAGPRLAKNSYINAAGGGGTLVATSHSPLIPVAITEWGQSGAVTDHGKREGGRIPLCGPGIWHQRDRLYQWEVLTTKTAKLLLYLCLYLPLLHLPYKCKTAIVQYLFILAVSSA